MTVGVIGAGAAGIVAGAFAAAGNCDTEILDGNEKVGKKLFLTGKGRCNITNSADFEDFIKAIPHNGSFLYGAFRRFFSGDIIRILNSQGVKTKLERGGRYFPESDKSSDVIRALTTYAQKCGAKISLHSRVTDIKYDDPGFTVSVEGKTPRHYDKLIIATGGRSYPSTGSTGSGYAFAQKSGHTIMPAKPSLIPFVTNEKWAGTLAGLSLKNVVLKAYTPADVKNKINKGKKCRPRYEELGEMLFTHTGVSGPLVLSASSFLADDPAGALLEIDLKPALSHEKLDARVLRDFEKYAHKQIKNAMHELLPQRLIEPVLEIADVKGDISVDNITREQRLSIVSTLKSLKMTVCRALPIEEAIITRGGVCVKEINPATMESRLVPGLYFAGEVIDADACTGGYNLQIAWSTGAVAGMSAAEYE